MPIAEIHPLVLGTMRLAEKELGASQVSELLLTATAFGVNSLHVSSEYPSFALLSDAMQKMTNTQRQQFQLIAKIAGPHFDTERFSEQDLEQRIDEVLQQLGVEQLAIAQWMWRLNPLDDDLRIARMTEQAQEIRDAFSGLVSRGKVAEFGCFPYSDRFMQSAFELNLATSHINYLNPWEIPLFTGGLSHPKQDAELTSGQECELNLKDRKASAIAMRPLGAGKISQVSAALLQQISQDIGIEHASVAELCVKMAYCHPQVRALVISCSKVEQVQSLTEQLAATTKSEQTFHRYLAATETLRHAS